MCSGADDCGSFATLQWRISPPQLSHQVGTLSSLPGVPDSTFKAVASRWLAHPPAFKGKVITLSKIAGFMEELLASDPFGMGDRLPYVDLKAPSDNKVVAISQRQLAFIVANSLMGNTVNGTAEGLSAALKRCSQAGKSTFLLSLLSLLAVNSVELSGDGVLHDGTMLIGATPTSAPVSWKQSLSNTTLEPPVICGKGSSGLGAPCNVSDFMAGGTPFQALTDIAGGDVGGGAQLCDIAFTQDESLVQFYSEVLAFAFFTTQEGNPMLPVPFTLLGARRIVNNITGETSNKQADCGSIQPTNWLNSAILDSSRATIGLGSKSVSIVPSSFVAVASYCIDCHKPATCTPDQLLNNGCDFQRRHIDEDVGLWMAAYSPTAYNHAISAAFGTVVRRAGTGPWGAGAWLGDSQYYFLVVWLATTVGALGLDYYIYDHFCENPGNQCFLLGGSACGACIASGATSDTIHAARCGQKSLGDMITGFSKHTAQDLYTALQVVGKPPAQVFDAIKLP